MIKYLTFLFFITFSFGQIINQSTFNNINNYEKYIICEKISQYYNNSPNNLPLLNKQDSINFSLENQKNNSVEYVQILNYIFKDKNQERKIFFSKNAGINKPKNNSFYKADYSLDLDKDSIKFQGKYFINPIKKIDTQNIIFDSINRKIINFNNKNYKGKIFYSEKEINYIINKFENNQKLYFNIVIDLENKLIKNINYKSETSTNYITEINLYFHKNIFNNPLNENKIINYIKKKNYFLDSVLSEREKNTFEIEDKINYNNNKKTFYNNLIKYKKISFNQIDFKPYDFISYNAYEGFRFQIGTITNKNFSKHLTLKNYIAFGTNDENFKFGTSVEYQPKLSNQKFINLGYLKDVNPAGRFDDFNFDKNKYSLLKQVSNFNYADFYKLEDFSIGFSDFEKKLKYNLLFNYQNIKPDFNFLYKNSDLFERYSIFSSKISFLFAPNKKEIKTNFGKVTVKDNPPYINLDLEKSFDFLNSDFNFSKIQIKFSHSQKTFKGETQIILKASNIFGDAPLTHLYEGLGTYKIINNFWDRLNISTSEHFETMIPGTFFTDKYVSFSLKHEFIPAKILGKKIKFNILYKSLLGEISERNKVNNSSFNFKVPNNLFQEVGLEIPNLLLKNNLGIGFYYKIGSYSEPKFDQNFAFKFIINID